MYNKVQKERRIPLPGQRNLELIQKSKKESLSSIS